MCPLWTVKTKPVACKYFCSTCICHFRNKIVKSKHHLQKVSRLSFRQRPSLSFIIIINIVPKVPLQVTHTHIRVTFQIRLSQHLENLHNLILATPARLD